MAPDVFREADLAGPALSEDSAGPNLVLIRARLRAISQQRRNADRARRVPLQATSVSDTKPDRG